MGVAPAYSHTELRCMLDKQLVKGTPFTSMHSVYTIGLDPSTHSTIPAKHSTTNRETATTHSQEPLLIHSRKRELYCQPD